MSDLISRQDAKRIVSGDGKYFGRVGRNVLHEMWTDICSLPSADSPTGEWVDIDNYYRMATCSRCHKVTMFEKWGEYTRSYNYCPNCGAKMFKGGEE